MIVTTTMLGPRLLPAAVLLLICCCVYGKDNYILDVAVKCGARLTNGPIINILTDVALTAKAVCTGGDQMFKTTDKVHFALTGSYTGSAKACRWQKHTGIYTYTIDVHVRYGEVGSMITTKDKIKTIVCTYNQHGTDDSPALAVNDPYISPQELGTIVGATLPSNQFTLSIQDVQNKDVVGGLNADRKYSIYVKYTGSVRGSSLKPVSCDAVAGNGVRYAVLRAGCGDGLVFPKGVGFDVSYLSFRSPYFQGFHLQNNKFVSFECKVVLCNGRCDGSTCSRSCAARPTFSVTNGKLSKCVGLKYKNTCSYTCNTGYNQVGNGISTCGPDALWTKPAITCPAKNCGTLPTIRFGSRTAASTLYPSRARYTCVAGYLVSKSYIQCLATGKWDTPPVCNARTCGAAPKVANSASRSAPSAVFLGSIKYTCKPGYLIYRRIHTVLCRSSGRYTTSPQCRPISCGPAPSVANSRRSATFATYPNRIHYTCNLRYALDPSRTYITCGSNGKYTTPPTCKRGCQSPDSIRNGKYRITGKLTGAKVTYYCNAGYTLSGKSTYTCLGNGGWSGKPSCRSVLGK